MQNRNSSAGTVAKKSIRSRLIPFLAPILAILMLAAVFLPRRGYRIRTDISKFENDPLTCNCNMDYGYTVFYEIWIYKGFEPIKCIVINKKSFCKKDYKAKMDAINLEVKSYQHKADSLIRTVVEK